MSDALKWAVLGMDHELGGPGFFGVADSHADSLVLRLKSLGLVTVPPDSPNPIRWIYMNCFCHHSHVPLYGSLAAPFRKNTPDVENEKRCRLETPRKSG